MAGNECLNRTSIPDGCDETGHNRTSSPVRTDLDVMEDDATSPLVLEGQQLVSVLPLLLTVLLEEMGEAWKGHIVTGEVKGL